MLREDQGGLAMIFKGVREEREVGKKGERQGGGQGEAWESYEGREGGR